jgi:hypothetical protein
MSPPCAANGPSFATPRVPFPKPRLPAVASLERQWRQFREEAARQERSVFELSSVAAISAVRQLPDNVRWLSRVARVTARRTTGVLFETLLSHYWLTLSEIHQTGFWRFWMREFQPYLAGALRQFSPARESLTERLLATRKRPRSVTAFFRLLPKLQNGMLNGTDRS